MRTLKWCQTNGLTKGSFLARSRPKTKKEVRELRRPQRRKFDKFVPAYVYNMPKLPSDGLSIVSRTPHDAFVGWRVIQLYSPPESINVVRGPRFVYSLEVHANISGLAPRDEHFFRKFMYHS